MVARRASAPHKISMMSFMLVVTVSLLRPTVYAISTEVWISKPSMIWPTSRTNDCSASPTRTAALRCNLDLARMHGDVRSQ